MTAKLRGHGDTVWKARFSPDGRHVATASKDSVVRVFRAQRDDEPILLRGHRAQVLDVAWSPDGQRLVSASQDTTVRLWSPFEDPARSTVVARHEKTVTSVDWSGDGRHLVTASLDGSARLWKVHATPTRIVFNDHDGPVNAARFSPDGQQAGNSTRSKFGALERGELE